MAKSNGCIWAVEWAVQRNGTGAAANLTWRFLSAFDIKRRASLEALQQGRKTQMDPPKQYRVTKYVPAGKP